MEAIRPNACPHRDCASHADSTGWRYTRCGCFYSKVAAAGPHGPVPGTERARVQRYRCHTCRKTFSDRSFAPDYWLKKNCLRDIFFGVISCSSYRQIAYRLQVAPSTVMRQAERLGRHCLLFQEAGVPTDWIPTERLVIDGFESFELSQYHPHHLNVAVGGESYFLHRFNYSPLRRKGRMTPRQKRKREELERIWGRPDPKSIEKEVANLVRLVTRGIPCSVRIDTDQHPAYRRAFRNLRKEDFEIEHVQTHSRDYRGPKNYLFSVNVTDLLIRHTGSNHKRETIAFSKRRRSVVLRMGVFQVWRNWLKSRSEKLQDETPAQFLRLCQDKLTVDDVLRKRLFPGRVRLPDQWKTYYEGKLRTPSVPNAPPHDLKYAF